MASGGRNDRCSCGSGRKAKRCCGVVRGPSETELARAWLNTEARNQGRLVVGCDEDELLEVVDEMIHLPARDLSLQLPLPRLLSPELERLRAAVAAESVEEVVDALPAAMAQVDSPPRRRALARAVLAYRDIGGVDRVVAAAAVVELAMASSSRLLRNSLLEAVTVSVGAARTPSGLLVAAR